MLKPQRNLLRELICLDGYWAFRPDPAAEGEQAGWPGALTGDYELAVPGSWNEQRTQLENFFGRGWYATSFPAPATWVQRNVRLHFGAAQNHARVWINGQFAGEHRGGSLPFDCDITPHLRLGASNLLVVEVDGSLNPWDLPAARIESGAPEGFHNSNPAITYDFFPYCGLGRSVHLEVTSTPARITRIQTDYRLNLAKREAAIEVAVDWQGATHGEIGVEIEGERRTVPLPSAGTARVRLSLANVRLWDVGLPELYTVVVSLSAPDGRIVDRYEQVLGLREIRATSDALLLNGRPVFLKGYGKHEDFPLTGRAMPPAAIIRDFELMRWTGANSFRTSHYPYAEEWYEHADRQGFLVIGESPLVGLCTRLFEGPDVLQRAQGIVGDMLARDRHHPSVIAWSVANEPWIETPSGEVFIAALLDHARSLDASRPITYVAHMETVHNAPAAKCDIVCVNKYHGWYEQPGDIVAGTRRLGETLDQFRAAFGKPVLFSEFGADALPGLHALPATMFSEEFQAEIIEAQYREASRRPWIVGTHVWTFADFKTPQSITRVVRNHKGIFTRDRTPKLAAHTVRRLWHEPTASKA